MAKPLICPTPYCRNTPAKGRKHCQKCRVAAWRTKNPMLAAYHATKSSAKSRGIYFGITLADFAEFATRHKLLSKRGRQKDAWHIDRIDNSKGYVAGNLQPLTSSENSRKGSLSRGISTIYRHRCQLLEMGFPSTELAAIYRPLAAEAQTATHIVTYDFETKAGRIIKIDLLMPVDESIPF